MATEQSSNKQPTLFDLSDPTSNGSGLVHTSPSTYLGTSTTSIKTRITLGMSNWSAPVRYIDPGLTQGSVDETWVKDLAEYVSTLACKAVDIARGHLSIDYLQGLLTPICIQKFALFVRILHTGPHGSPIGVLVHSDSSLSYPPIVPTHIEIFALSETAAEAIVSIMVIGQRYQVNLRIEVQGSNWVCSLLDMG
ncbi:hypothetical protein [Bombiscardovia coagulans]|uniref:Uncharacterized protein n=1 Tax=Bombiscardovia coagulans TaxID=686666 RepID=A0A261ETD5_9BIFI|nr:hypothetical protein [Bombiscardovia coagulans]OZG49926.1 hypothetical protein BOCO_0443 [Bombiscardovia coagulans]